MVSSFDYSHHRGIFSRHRVLAGQVETLIRVYYFALLGVANFFMLPQSVHTGLFPLYHWPLNIFDGVETGRIQLACTLSLIGSCIFAGLFTGRQWTRVCVFISLFLANSIVNSGGGETHLYQFWLWSAFVLALIPSRHKNERRFGQQLLVGWWGAQTLILLFYGLSGLWKAIGIVQQVARHEPNFLSLNGLSYHLGSEMIRAGSRPLLGDWLLAHQTVSPLLAIGALMLQLLCWMAIPCLRLRKWMGIGLIVFHLGTYFFLAITYPTNVLLVGLTLASSPWTLVTRRRWPKFNWRPLPRLKFFFAKIVSGVLVSYLALALLTGIFAPKGEVFPFFNGHWFVQVPCEINDYGLLVYSLDGKDLNPPLYIENIYDRFTAWPFAMYGAIQSWGVALTQHSENTPTNRAFALKLIFADRKFHAELRKRRMDPLDFVQNHHVLNEETLDSVNPEMTY